jgi:hypothetical protein
MKLKTVKKIGQLIAIGAALTALSGCKEDLWEMSTMEKVIACEENMTECRELVFDVKNMNKFSQQDCIVFARHFTEFNSYLRTHRCPLVKAKAQQKPPKVDSFEELMTIALSHASALEQLNAVKLLNPKTESQKLNYHTNIAWLEFNLGYEFKDSARKILQQKDLIHTSDATQLMGALIACIDQKKVNINDSISKEIKLVCQKDAELINASEHHIDMFKSYLASAFFEAFNETGDPARKVTDAGLWYKKGKSETLTKVYLLLGKNQWRAAFIEWTKLLEINLISA